MLMTFERALEKKYLGLRPAVMPAEAAANLLVMIAAHGPEDRGGLSSWHGKPIPW